MREFQRALTRVAFLLFSSLAFSGCARAHPAAAVPPNPIAEYLEGVEVQAEEAQQENICRAIGDLAALAAEDLRRRRYADYQGVPGVWDLPRLLHAYLVPNSSAKVLPPDGEFWRHAHDAVVRRAAEKLYISLRCGSQDGPR